MECPACHGPVDSSQRACPACGGPQSTPQAGAPADPMVGKTLSGKYRVVRRLGEGGMGAVYLGEQQMGTTIRRVAIKAVHPRLSKDPEIMARFEREVGTIAELLHPNTIQVHDFGTTDDGLLYLVMEFIDGTNVATALESGPMDPRRTERIMSQVCGSLEEAHSRGIVHRDMKPENVVLTERAGQKDFVKVLDFGIATRLAGTDAREQKLTQQGTVLGTPPYMSPEQFTGAPIDARSDIYSLGVMTYEMLTGRLPFDANTVWDWATQHMTVRPAPFESTPSGAAVPQRMRDATMKALEKDPLLRWGTVREFSDAFAGAAAKPVMEVPPPDPLRGKTQIGEPIAASHGFAPPPCPAGLTMGGVAPVPLSPEVMQQGIAVAQDWAVSPVAPQPPAPRHRTAGADRRAPFVAMGVIGLLGAGALTYAVVSHEPAPSRDTTVPDAAPLEGGPPAPDAVADVFQPLLPLEASKTVVPPPPPKRDAGVRRSEPPECAAAREIEKNPSFRTNQALQAVHTARREACLRGGGHL
jgi:eukaryotic-like serine/threonine-protein kinase